MFQIVVALAGNLLLPCSLMVPNRRKRELSESSSSSL